MMRVVGCVFGSHDLTLVIVAAVVCIAGSWATTRLFKRAVATTETERAAWLVLTSVVAGAAIWCTHFIAMLGYNPGVPVGFDPVLTIVSLLTAVAGTLPGFAIAAGRWTRFVPALGGAIVGLSISAMHYTGMLAYRVQGIISWDMSYLVASVTLAVLLSALALHIAVRRDVQMNRQIATGMLVLAIVSLHFTGMTAFSVVPMLVEGTFSNPDALRALALAVTGVAVVVVGSGAASHLIDNRARAEAAEALINMSNGLIMVAGNGTIRLYNNRVLQLLGLAPEQLSVGMTLAQFLHNVGSLAGWDATRTRRVIENHYGWMAATDATRVEHHFDDGRILSVSCQPMPDKGAILTYDDITEARERQKQIAHMAFHDALTGLPNRRSFTEHVSRLANDGAFAMIMLDLDRFKVVNDTLGHSVGDALLVEVACRLRDTCPVSEMLFRLGGDELAVLSTLPLDQAEEMAAAMVHTLMQPFQIGAHNISIGGSVGLAMAAHGDDPVVVQRMADLALYRAKENGRSRVEIYREGMLEEASSRRKLEIDLAIALQAGQFELHYQPLYELPSRKLSGFEALLRWHHPEFGLVSPAKFIPVAEQCGAIVKIGAWVIEEACRQVSLWPPGIYVSINVSPVQMHSVDILRQITQALDRYGLSPRRLEIEMTETALVENREQIATTLANLRALGIRIAMDDFGTGYSSLAHLRDFELDRIKIDRSFIAAAHSDASSAAVVRAITAMANSMAIATTGEGVENEEQLANLIEVGCGTAQGYLLGKPFDARRATLLLKMQSKTSDAVRIVR